MINISFVNSFYLLIAIPLLALVIIPFCIAIRKDNRSVSVITSLILHLVMVGLIALSAAGTTLTAVITKTQVYVVADVSYSTDRELDTVDDYIREVKDSMPRNSKMGVVCFGTPSLAVSLRPFPARTWTAAQRISRGHWITPLPYSRTT